MLNNLKKLATLALAASGVVVSGYAHADSKTYVVGTEAGYAPYEYLDEQGNIVGFDIDLINYLCKEAGITCTIKNQSFDALVPNLMYRKIDIAIAAMNVTPERAKQVAFTQEYLPASPYAYLVTKTNNYQGVNDFTAVGYQNGTLAAKYLQDKVKNVRAVGYDSYDTALLDLKSGRISALLADYQVAAKYVENNQGQYTLFGQPVSDPILGQGLAIAVNKNNKELLAKLNVALDKAKESGYLAQLQEKYNVTYAE
ncbi:transporter substrate-binding domain-containing protein [Psittacicella gerlachiana]|uniref:Solute-binding protein family 3/N-terminal domain-containing protein n=1 Tax=Psittacicella gerlachiana TaxID=2028574 RepID=A0A3A1YJW9_9GAMM|nr:transporter substrate-binding domain-containing protein [Psittacicella gerlachiana]RIY37498.1 hypothetical protein CKF59_01700 [Psittacicella gerlachiana]